jgi:nucleoid-associated protein YgaU
MLKFMPKETMMQWAVGAVVVAGAASVAYVLVFPKETITLQAPRLGELTEPVASLLPADDITPDTRLAMVPPTDALAPRFDIVRVTDLGNVLVAGKAPASSAIAALLEETPVAQTVSTGAGEFVMMFDVTPSLAPRVLELEVRLPNGDRVRSRDTLMLAPRSDVLAGQRAPDGTGLPTQFAREVTTPPLFPDMTTAPARPDVPATPETAMEAPLAVLMRSDGTVQVLGASGQLPDADQVVIDSVVYDSQGDVALGGRSARGLADIQIYLDNQPILRTRAANDGTWQAQLDGIERGVYRLRVDELDTAQQVTSRAEIPFERVTPDIARDATGPQALIVQPGNTLWAMSQQSFGDATRFMRIYEANRDQIRNPNLIYPGQVFILPADDGLEAEIVGR